MRHLKHVILALLLSGAFTILSAQSVWTTRASGTTNSLNSVTWTGSQLVAVGGNSGALIGTIVTSPDGVNWTPMNLTTRSLNWITWTGTQLVAVGDTGIIWTSQNGVNWTARTSGTTNKLAYVIWTGNQLVAVGYTGTILTSPDGVTWTRRTSGTTSSQYAVTWTGSQFVSVGQSVGNVILTSPDAVTWTTRTSPVTNFLSGITWTGSQLVAVGTGGTVLTSPDGVSWTARTSVTSVNNQYDVTWTGSQLVAVGNTASVGAILSSPDGITWTSWNSGTANGLNCVIWTGSQLVVVGTNGTILTSSQNSSQTIPAVPTLLAPAQSATSVPISTTLTWNASNGTTSYRVQLSTDSTFASTVINDSTTGTSRNITGLLNNKIYYWRVNAKNATGTSSYSVIRHFTTVALTAPPSPTLITPAQNATGVQVSTTLTWSASNGATSYRVQLSTDSTFATMVINDSTLTGTSRIVTGLLNNKIYYWRVNAKSATGTSAYSAIWNFTTTALFLPAFPVLNTPTQNATGVSTSPTLTWNASSGATTYRLQVSANSGFTTTVVNDSTITTNSRTIGPLTTNTVYYWRVNAKNAAGTSGYSAIWNFTASTVAILPRGFTLQSLDLSNGQSLSFVLPQRTHVIIQLFNSQGRMISQLLDETRNAGYYTLPLTNEPRGSYYLDFRAGDYHKTVPIQP